MNLFENAIHHHFSDGFQNTRKPARKKTKIPLKTPF